MLCNTALSNVGKCGDYMVNNKHECCYSCCKEKLFAVCVVYNLSIQSSQYRVEPQKISSKGFIVSSASAGHGEFQKKSLRKSDPGKGVNLHIFKMAVNETNNVLLTVYG